MGWLNRLFGGEERSDSVFLTTAPPTWSGASVGPDQAMRLSVVWSCVRLLADTVSTLPVDVYRGTQNLPLPPLLVTPAAGQPRHDWLYQVMVSLLLRGNAYGVVTARSGAALRPAQIELANPDRVVVERREGRVTYRIGGVAYDPEDVWHVRAYPVPGEALGLSPVEYARQAIGLGLAAEKFGAQFFGDGATPSGVLTTTQGLSQIQAEAVATSWRQAHADRRKVAVLSNGLQFTPIAIAPEESQFIETQRFTVAQIARVFGVPPEMVGSDAGNSLTYSNVESRALDFLRYSVQPWLIRLETALSGVLPRDQFVRFNAGGLLRATTKDRYEAHEVALRAGFLTINEVRALEDLPPLEGHTND